jgi:imidazolonepropionase-like amidohydrolase
MYDLWAKMIFEFNRRGGTIVYGTDDNYQWSTGGFGNIRELQLVLESGIHPLEVLKTAQLNSAKFLAEPHLGMVQEGFVADLIVVDGNPAWDFKTLYPFGTIRMDPETKEMYRTRGILHTIKDGIVIENDRVMAEVERIVAESKQGVGPDVVTEPFVVRRRPAGSGGRN